MYKALDRVRERGGSDDESPGASVGHAHRRDPGSCRLRDHCLAFGDGLGIVGGGQPSAIAAATAGSSRAPSPSPSSAIAVRCDKTPKPFNATKVELTGAWNGDDGGIYYLRQLGSVVWWNGMDGRSGSPANLGRDWSNVGRGQIVGLKIQAEWADVPRGGILGNGTMSLKVVDDGTGNVQITKESETGSGFGNSLWVPCTPG